MSSTRATSAAWRSTFFPFAPFVALGNQPLPEDGTQKGVPNRRSPPNQKTYSASHVPQKPNQLRPMSSFHPPTLQEPSKGLMTTRNIPSYARVLSLMMMMFLDVFSRQRNLHPKGVPLSLSHNDWSALFGSCPRLTVGHGCVRTYMTQDTCAMTQASASFT